MSETEEGIERMRELAAEDQPVLVRMLNRVLRLMTHDGGLLQQAVFELLTFLRVGFCIEVLVLRRVEEHWEILLQRQQSTEPHWPDQWRVFGRTTYPLDAGNGRSHTVVFEKLSKQLGIEDLHERSFSLGTSLSPLCEGQRGSEAREVMLYVLEAEQQINDVGTWYRVDELPDDLMDHHRWFIGHHLLPVLRGPAHWFVNAILDPFLKFFPEAKESISDHLNNS